MVRIQKLPNGQLVITIPKRLAELKNWGKGTDIEFKEHSKNSFIIQIKQEESKKEVKEVKRANEE